MQHVSKLLARRHPRIPKASRSNLTSHGECSVFDFHRSQAQVTTTSNFYYVGTLRVFSSVKRGEILYLLSKFFLSFYSLFSNYLSIYLSVYTYKYLFIHINHSHSIKTLQTAWHKGFILFFCHRRERDGIDGPIVCVSASVFLAQTLGAISIKHGCAFNSCLSLKRFAQSVRCSASRC